MEQSTLNPLEPSCRQRRRHDQAPPSRSCVGRTASCLLPGRHPLVELLCAGGGDFADVRDPIPCISLPERLLGGRRRCVDRALFRDLNACVYGLHFLGGFTFSMYLDGNSAASSEWATDGALSKVLAGNVYDYLCFSSVSSAASGARAPFRISHVPLPTSAVNAPCLANICRGTKLTECTLTFFVLSSSVALTRSYSTPSVNLDFLVFARKLVPSSHFGRQTFKPTLQGSSNFHHGHC